MNDKPGHKNLISMIKNLEPNAQRQMRQQTSLAVALLTFGNNI